MASERAWLCSHLDFGHQASRSWREYISAVLSQPLSGNLLLGSNIIGKLAAMSFLHLPRFFFLSYSIFVCVLYALY